MAKRYPLVCIIALSYDAEKMIRKCVDALFRVTKYPNYKVIIVENGSKKACADASRRRFKKADHVWIKKNRFFGGGMNAGMKYALKKYDPDYMLLLSNDVVVSRQDWLAKMVKDFEYEDKVGLVTAAFSHERKSDRAAIMKRGAIVEGEWLSNGTGPAPLIKSEVIKKVGLFDENFRQGFEDADLWLRIRNAGYKILRDNTLVLDHIGGYTHVLLGKKPIDTENPYFYLSLVNSVYFARKNLKPPERELSIMRFFAEQIVTLHDEQGNRNKYIFKLRDRPLRRLQLAAKALKEGNSMRINS